MYESFYKGLKSTPQPSGFSLKFSRSGNTNLFGKIGNNSKKWTPENVFGEKAQLFGVTIDTKGQADFLKFHMCAGALGIAPSPDVAIFTVPTQSGCFNGPRAGKCSSSTSYITNSKVPQWCRVKEITSCNQKNTSNGPIWCYIKTKYFNCPDSLSASGECGSGKGIG